MPQEKDNNAEWLAQRDLNLKKWIRNDAAVRWLLDVVESAEMFDDVYDSDAELDKNDWIGTMYKIMIDAPANPFFQSYSHILIPQMSLVMLSWTAASRIEDDLHAENFHLSYGFRSVHVMLVLSCIEICRGRTEAHDMAPEVCRFFCTETYQQYLDELFRSRVKVNVSGTIKSA